MPWKGVTQQFFRVKIILFMTYHLVSNEWHMLQNIFSGKFYARLQNIKHKYQEVWAKLLVTLLYKNEELNLYTSNNLYNYASVLHPKYVTENSNTFLNSITNVTSIQLYMVHPAIGIDCFVSWTLPSNSATCMKPIFCFCFLTLGYDVMKTSHSLFIQMKNLYLF